MNLKRTRFQQGSLTIEKRKNGPDAYVYRWREIGADGEAKRRKQIIGTKANFASKAAALRAIEGLKLDINTSTVCSSSTPLTVNQLIQHYRLTELCAGAAKTQRTKDVYEHQLDHVISPRWGSHLLREVKPIAVETWLNAMTVAPGTRYKTKGVLSVLFQHAMRYEWAASNPIRLVRQSAMPVHEQIRAIAFEIALNHRCYFRRPGGGRRFLAGGMDVLARDFGAIWFLLGGFGGSAKRQCGAA